MPLAAHRPLRSLAALAPPLVAVAICLAGSLLVLAALGYGTEHGQSLGPAAGGMARIVWNKAILPGKNYRGWIQSLQAATPLLLTGLAVTVAFRAGVLNIGGEGQFLLGAIAATAVGVRWVAPGALVLPALLLASAVAGAMLAVIAAILDRWRNVPVVLSTLLLNFVAGELLTVVLHGPLQGSDMQPASDQFPPAARLPQWIPAGGKVGLHWGCALALAVALLVALLLRRTVFGFRLRMVGENPTAARFAGISVGRVAFFSLALSGALAGLAGGIQVAGVESYQLLLSMREGGLGFAGIAVALLGRLSVGGAVAAALFFGLLNTAFGALQEYANVPFVTGQATQGTILIAMLVLIHPELENEIIASAAIFAGRQGPAGLIRLRCTIMTKPSVFYVGMFAVLIAGLWIIMRMGGTIQAPADMRGVWHVRWNTPASSTVSPAPMPFDTMTIEQSGLFVTLRLDDKAALEGRFNQEGPDQITGTARSRDGHWAMDLRRSNDGRLHGRLTSPSMRSFIALKAVNDDAASPTSEPADD